MLSAHVSITQAFLTAACIFLLYKILKYFTGEVRELQANSASNRRRLGHSEELLDFLSMEKTGTANICLAIYITSKRSLVHQHVHDALVLLAKRQPMLRAVIATMANGDKYFEIKEINTVITMLDITTSDVKASDWQDVWFEYTAKQRGNGLLWRVVILQEEFIPDTKDYANILMFNINHSCFDGVSSVKFCKQFLDYMNKLANGTSCVDQEISSLDLLPPYHKIVTRGRIWHSLFNFVLAYCGLRPILKMFMERMLTRLIEKKPNNPYHEQFPPNLDTCSSPVPPGVKVFTKNETKNIIKACKENNCTVTGAIAAAAHLAFCQILQDDKSKDVKLECQFAVNAQRFCDPKPDEDYLGVFVYSVQDYLKYLSGSNVDFWKLAQEITQQIKGLVSSEACVNQETVIHGILRPKELVNQLQSLFAKSRCNYISSFGSFHFGDMKQQAVVYELHECYINALLQNMNYTFAHFNYTINGKMTWQIESHVTVDINHAEMFANLCFNKLIEISRGRI